jgi:dTDP-4-amino-4,6-dideoxygalactose transaminase
VRESGAWLLEDACQAMLTRGVGSTADFVLFTPRKFVGVPEGGILISNRPEINFQDISLEPPPPHWWMMALNAAVLRREFDLYGGDRRWFELYRSLEEDMPMGRYAMSDMSKMLMASAFDYSLISQKRIKNYQVLAGELSHLALYPGLPPGVVPLGFPVRLANRDEVIKMLYAKDIYPPVHWPFRGILPEEFTESYRLLGDIMMLPCDQRCEKEDMLRIVRFVGQNAVPVQLRVGQHWAQPI